MNDTNEQLPGIKVLNALMALGAAAVPVKNDANSGGLKPFAVIPEDTKVADLAAYFPPQRIGQRVLLLEAGSFIAYVNRYSTESTQIFANITEDGASFQAVLDYHGAAPALVPAYGAHVAAFDTIKTPEFKTWMAANRQPMTQVKFAEFLEENAKLFTDPTGADLLELVQTLYGKQDVQFTSGTRLQSGTNKLDYDEVVELRGQSSAANGALELPKEITATFSLYQGSAAYVVRARLKYRIESRKLVLWFETIAVPDMVRHALMSLVQQIAAAKTPADAELLAPGTGIMPLLGRLQ